MLTPKYSFIKQFCYREVLDHKIRYAFDGKAIHSLSLAGAHCLENPDSNERRIIENCPNSIVTIVECRLKSVKNILKSLPKAKVKREKFGHRYLYSAKIGSVKVEVFHGYMHSYLKAAKKTDRRHHVVIADYYSTLNRKVISDLELLRDGLLAKKALLFITSSDPRRASTQEICQMILNRDTNKEKSYKGGMREYLKGFFRKTLKDITMHNYTNSDVSKKAVEMYVAMIQVA
jgi:hypothetical protein